VQHAANGSDLQKLSPWPPPPGGLEHLLKHSRWERRREPLTRQGIIIIRLTFLVAGVLAGVAFAVEPPSSLWWQAALGGLISATVTLASLRPYQLAQILGLRPPWASRP
jgi:hypothetical protein